MNATLLAALRRELPELTIRRDVPWREITSLGAGGSIPVLADVRDDRELAGTLAFAREHRLPVLVVAGGTNLVGMDAPCPALVLRLHHEAFRQIRTGTTHLTAGTEVSLPELARTAAAAGLGGLAPLSGIPGRLGGAIRMNAGANGHTISEFLVQLAGIRLNGELWTAEASELHWGYRTSDLPEDVILTAAILQLKPTTPESELAAIRAEQQQRREREPSGRTAGCMFRNVSELDPAGKLIDRAGLKGAAVGGAAVSCEHANYLLNRGDATEHDVVTLMQLIRQRVADETGLYLEPEVRFANPGSLEAIRKQPAAPQVALLKGGTSTEREISLRSGAAVAAALRNAGLEVTEIDLKKCEVTPEMRAADVVYPVLHGGFGEDGGIQRELEQAGLAFVGSGSAASRLVMDKLATKRLLRDRGLPTAPWAEITREHPAFPEGLKFPVVIKAPNQGSSIGIVKVDRAADWEAALEREFAYDDTLLVEQFIDGSELTVPLVGGRALPVIEIHTPHGFYDFDAKYVYQHGRTAYACPPDTLPEALQREAQRLALAFSEAAGCRDLLRVDFMADRAGRLYILEGNTLPGCTATSLVPKAARVAGLSFERLTAGLVRAALKRQQENH